MGIVNYEVYSLKCDVCGYPLINGDIDEVVYETKEELISYASISEFKEINGMWYCDECNK